MRDDAADGQLMIRKVSNQRREHALLPGRAGRNGGQFLGLPQLADEAIILRR
jgi:hypothetical protein